MKYPQLLVPMQKYGRTPATLDAEYEFAPLLLLTPANNEFEITSLNQHDVLDAISAGFIANTGS